MSRLSALPHPKRSDSPTTPAPSRPVAAVAQPRRAALSSAQRSLPGLAPTTGEVVRSVAPPTMTFGAHPAASPQSLRPTESGSGVAVQRLRKHAMAYANANPGLGLSADSISRDSIIEFIAKRVPVSSVASSGPKLVKRPRSPDPLSEDDKKLYRGLIYKWNIGQKSNQHIQVPASLEPTITEVDTTGETWKTLEKFDVKKGAQAVGFDELLTLRRRGSDDLSARLGKIEAPKKGDATDLKRMKLSDYADHTVYMGLGDYSATSAEKSNFVVGKSMSGVQGSEYKSLLPEEEKLIKDPKSLATLHLHGLFDHDKYKQALEPFSEDQRNLFNMTTSLLANEILGRSRSNLIDVTASLVTTAVQGGKLSDNLLSYGLFTPNKTDDTRNVGGAELSKIGRVGSALTFKGLSSKNQELVANNQAMFGSFLETAGSTDELDKAIKELNERFVSNASKFTFAYK